MEDSTLNRCAATQDLLFDAVTTLQVIAGDIPSKRLYWLGSCAAPPSSKTQGRSRGIMKDNRHLELCRFDIRQAAEISQVLNQPNRSRNGRSGPGRSPPCSLLTTADGDDGPRCLTRSPEPRGLEYDSVVQVGGLCRVDGSPACGGRWFDNPRLGWASRLFTRLCVTGTSLLVLSRDRYELDVSEPR